MRTAHKWLAIRSTRRRLRVRIAACALDWDAVVDDAKLVGDPMAMELAVAVSLVMRAALERAVELDDDCVPDPVPA